jgi:hypothetical protein
MAARAGPAREMATVTRGVGNDKGDGEDARGGRMMVATGHGLYVSFCLCGETTKYNFGPKNNDDILELIDHARLAIANTCSGGAI